MQATVAYVKHGRRSVTLLLPLISLCHGSPATAGHRASPRGGQAPDKRQRPEALLPRNQRQRARSDRMGEETLVVAFTLAQRRRSTDDRASGATGCKLQTEGRHVCLKGGYGDEMLCSVFLKPFQNKTLKCFI